MRSFQSFIAEATTRTTTRYGDHQALDDYRMSKRTDTPLEVGRIGPRRKKREVEKTRTKAVGGGKTAPAKNYKARKDIGTNKPRSKVEQQPTRERGSAALSAKEAQKKAYLERKARQAGAKTPTRTQLLSKKDKPKTDPQYKPQRASGYTAAERKAITRKGERKLRDLTLAATGKTKESELKHPITSKEITRRNRKK